MKVINLIGGPGSGKSTLASGLYYKMKRMGLSVELVTEYAKDIVWEERLNAFDQQEYIFAKQNRRLVRLKKKVDYVITDSPLFLGLFYLHNSDTPKSFAPFIKDVVNQYDNTYFFLNRKFKYDPMGRYQNESEALKIDLELKNILKENKTKAKGVGSNKKGIRKIIKSLDIKVCSYKRTED